jgi:mono/diheme cytochrome c family protein
MKIHPDVRLIKIVLASTLACVSFVFADRLAAKNADKASATTTIVQANNSDAMRVAGEQRFRTNCGRCHAAPQKFPPRMMKTVLRHMRVRATITDEDMKLVLFYMTQ